MHPQWERHSSSPNAPPEGTKQPNFLQKLYDFLALDPHPCPEIIYWASDSKQLVIAQPDRLVREVLPRLFKHDKLSSFGRQLNIYGFSRLYPGRQFKDANGDLSDASVWAHPSLHRLSTVVDINAIKRRAAPKLYRTRRLANGELVYARAGAAVEAKAREVRESIAQSRRHRSACSTLNGASQEMTDNIAIMGYSTDSRDPVLIASEDRLNQVLSPAFPDQYMMPMCCQPEAAADAFGVVSPSGLQRLWPHTPNAHARNASLSLDPVESTERFLQSCPASIHTSPVLMQRPIGVMPGAWSHPPEVTMAQALDHVGQGSSASHLESCHRHDGESVVANHQGGWNLWLNEETPPGENDIRVNLLAAWQPIGTAQSDAPCTALSTLTSLASPSFSGTIDPQWFNAGSAPWNGTLPVHAHSHILSGVTPGFSALSNPPTRGHLDQDYQGQQGYTAGTQSYPPIGVAMKSDRMSEPLPRVQLKISPLVDMQPARVSRIESVETVGFY